MTKITIDRALVEQALGALDVAAACIDVYYVPRGKTMPEIEKAQKAFRAAMAQQTEPKGGGNLPPLQTHCPNCAGPETQNTELDRKAASAKRGAALYHPCTYILILGLKKLNAYDVLAEWDKARAEVDALAPRQTEEIK